MLNDPEFPPTGRFTTLLKRYPGEHQQPCAEQVQRIAEQVGGVMKAECAGTRVRQRLARRVVEQDGAIYLRQDRCHGALTTT